MELIHQCHEAPMESSLGIERVGDRTKYEE